MDIMWIITSLILASVIGAGGFLIFKRLNNHSNLLREIDQRLTDLENKQNQRQERINELDERTKNLIKQVEEIKKIDFIGSRQKENNNSPKPVNQGGIPTPPPMEGMKKPWNQQQPQKPKIDPEKIKREQQQADHNKALKKALEERRKKIEGNDN